MGSNEKINVLLMSQSSTNARITRTNNHVEKLAEYFDDKIVSEVDIIGADNPIPEAFEKFLIDLDAGADFSELKAELSYDMKHIINDVRKKVKDSDIVHAHHTGIFFYAIMAKLFFDKKIVVTLHSLIEKKDFLKKSIGIKAYKQCLLLEKLLVEYADAIIVTYKQQKETFFKFYPNVNPNKVHIAHNGIDIKKYYSSYSLDVLSKYDINPSLPYILLVGKVKNEDDVDYIVKVIEGISILSQVAISLRVSKKSNILALLSERLEKLRKVRVGIASIPDDMPIEDRRVILSHASAVGYPLIYEPSAYNVLESLACGTPVVATALGEVREIIKHGDGGFLIEPGLFPDPPFEPADKKGFIRRMTAGINRIVEDRALNKRLSMRSRETVEQAFSWDKIVLKIELIYDKVMNI